MTVTPDGSPVAVYLRLPPRGEAELVDEVVAAGVEILELGCGVGRMSEPNQLVHARIEKLDLGRRFPCVLLASHFVNVEDDERDVLLQTCVRHLADDGVVLIERFAPTWTPEDVPKRQLGDVAVTLRDVHREGRRFAAVVEYELDGRTWKQPFAAVLLDDAELDRALRRAGLTLARRLDERGLWIEARRG